MAGNRVAKFRRVFKSRLESGNYEPIDVVQAVKALSTSAELVESLDVYCSLFDPARPPKKRESFELSRTTGFNLFARAVELADTQNGLLEMVQSFGGVASATVRNASLAKRMTIYRSRYDILDVKDRDDLQRRAKSVAKDHAAAASKSRFLLDDLERAFRTQNGRAPAAGELLHFDPGPRTARKEFERLATACDLAWLPKARGTAGVWINGVFIPTPGATPKAQTSSISATHHVESAFAAFGDFVQAQIKQPLDLFRLLAWAREPSDMYAKMYVRGEQTHVVSPSSAWSSVWRELYQDIATRGLHVAVNRWTVAQMIHARGYVGKDLQFILAPLEPHWKELVKQRLAAFFASEPAFVESQAGRRKAKVWGDMKGLELVDELEIEGQLKVMVAEFEKDTKAVLARKLRLSSSRQVFKSTYHIYEEERGVFTVIWIPKQARTDYAYVEVHAIPGLVFKAWGNRVGLVDLIEDKTYADLAANAMALAQFLLFYLQVLGYVLDVITAGATGGVRVVILRFIEERIKDKIVSEGLDLAGIDNPWVRTLAGMAAGFVPSAIKTPKIGAVKGLEELDTEAQTVTRGASKIRPAAAADVPTANVAAPKQAMPSVAPPVRPGVSVVNDHVFEIPNAPRGDAAKYAARAAAEQAPTVPSSLGRATNYVLDVADRAVEYVADRVPGRTLAGQTSAGGEHAAAGAMLATRLPAGKGLSRGVGGAGRLGGAGARATKRASAAVGKLESSADYQLLVEYEKSLMTSSDKVLSQRARVAIRNALQSGPGTPAAEADALSKIRGMLNKARSDAGEFNATADLYSSFDVDDLVAVPTRSNGVPVLDVAVKLSRRSKINAGKRFAFGEAKGGLDTQLGEVTPKRYFFNRGSLEFAPQRRALVPQASGEWYYQKFAEIYMMGQKLGGPEGRKMQSLANEMFDAAFKGEIATVVAKSNAQLERKYLDTTAEVVAYFTSKQWNRSMGFPVAK